MQQKLRPQVTPIAQTTPSPTYPQSTKPHQSSPPRPPPQFPQPRPLRSRNRRPHSRLLQDPFQTPNPIGAESIASQSATPVQRRASWKAPALSTSTSLSYPLNKYVTDKKVLASYSHHQDKWSVRSSSGQVLHIGRIRLDNT